MRSSKFQRAIPFILAALIIIIIITVVVTIGRAIISNSGKANDSQVSQVDVARDALLSLDGNHSVRMTVRGPIVADENFRSYQITVGPNSRSLVTYEGYLDKELNAIRLDNNSAAYDQFVHALDKANMTLGTPFTGEKDDTRGICATGRVYEFEVLAAGEPVQRLWMSTCGGSPGSFRASKDQVGSLFAEQIPDGMPLIRGIGL